MRWRKEEEEEEEEDTAPVSPSPGVCVCLSVCGAEDLDIHPYRIGFRCPVTRSSSFRMAARCNQFSIEHILGGGGGGGGGGGDGGGGGGGNGGVDERSGSKSPVSGVSDNDSSDEPSVVDEAGGVVSVGSIPAGSAPEAHPALPWTGCGSQWPHIKTPFFTLQGEIF